MKRWIIAALVCLSASAFAGDLGKARSLVALTLPRERYQDIIDKISTQMSAMLPRQKALPADFADRMKQVVEDVMPYGEMVDATAALFARHFTDGELEQLRAFYASPVGKKSAQLMPQLMQESMQAMSAKMMTRMPDALKRHGLLPK